MVILANTKVNEALEKYPELKDVLKSISPKYNRLDNEVVYRTIGKFASFKDVATIGSIPLCDLLLELNKEIGAKAAFLEESPECSEKKRKRPAKIINKNIDT